jgi:hypothetical protein
MKRCAVVLVICIGLAGCSVVTGGGTALSNSAAPPTDSAPTLTFAVPQCLDCSFDLTATITDGSTGAVLFQKQYLSQTAPFSASTEISASFVHVSLLANNLKYLPAKAIVTGINSGSGNVLVDTSAPITQSNQNMFVVDTTTGSPPNAVVSCVNQNTLILANAIATGDSYGLYSVSAIEANIEWTNGGSEQWSVCKSDDQPAIQIDVTL